VIGNMMCSAQSSWTRTAGDRNTYILV